MAMPSFGFTIKKLELISGYKELFEKAFPGEGINMITFGKAIASYERSLISGNSAFDKWYFGGDQNAVDESVKEGFKVFVGKGNCVSCHTIGQNEALFIDDKLHNTGVGYAESMGLLSSKKTECRNRVIYMQYLFTESRLSIVLFLLVRYTFLKDTLIHCVVYL